MRVINNLNAQPRHRATILFQDLSELLAFIFFDQEGLKPFGIYSTFESACVHNVYLYRISLQVFREIYITYKFWSHKVNKYWLRWRHWQGVRGGYIFIYIYIYIYKGQGVKFGVLYYQTFIIHNRYSLIITMIHENHSCLIYMIILNHSLKVNKDNLKKPWLYILRIFLKSQIIP